MRVLVVPADSGGCGGHRMRWPAEACAAQGYDVVVDPVGLVCGWDREWETSDDGRIPDDVHVLDVARPDADVVVLQRPLHRAWSEAIAILQAQGVTVVVEVDDDFDAIPRLNTARDAVDPHLSPALNRQWLNVATDLADLVTVSTPALARRYGAHGRVAVLRNCIPARYLDVNPIGHPLSVGWSGSIKTHAGDLAVVGPAVANVCGVTGARMAVVGDGVGVGAELGMRTVHRTGWVPLEVYPYMLPGFDVGICPLAPNAFNDAKSWLTPLAMAAAGVPAVMSPVAEYRAIHREGIGVLARSPSAWYRELLALLQSPSLRRKLAGRGKDVAARWTIEGHAEEWYAAWCAAHVTRRVTVCGTSRTAD